MADERAQRRRWRATVMARREGHVRGLTQRARAAGDELAAGEWWLAAARLARRYLRDAQRGGDDADWAGHRESLQTLIDDAEAQLAASEPSAVERARRGQGMRVAVIGKGGTGKSLIAATLARLLARRGRSVLACDLDPNPGLAYSLGVPPGHGELPDAVVAEHPGAPYGRALLAGVEPGEVVARHTVAAPDGVRFVSVGKTDDVDNDPPKRTLSALLEVVGGFAEPGWDVIGDLEAGPTTPFERYHAFADRVLLAVTPTWVSAMTARRLLPMVDDLDVDVVANQWRDEQAHPDLSPLAWLPYDQRVADAEHDGVAPLDACPDAPPIAELDRLAEQLTSKEVSVSGGCGKTMVAGALVAHLADRGHEIVAVDADPNPNLGVSLGISAPDVEDMTSILTGLQASGHTHDDPLPDPDELVARFGQRAPGGVNVVATGKIERPTDSCLCCGSHSTTRRFFGDLPAGERIVVADLEAGLNDLIWARPGADDVVVVVADRSAKSLDIAGRAAGVARQMGVQRIVAVANRRRGDEDAPRLGEATGAAVAEIPEDPMVATADRHGVAAFDADPTSPAMAAVGDLAELLVGAGV